jgi:hypothetical protein
MPSFPLLHSATATPFGEAHSSPDHRDFAVHSLSSIARFLPTHLIGSLMAPLVSNLVAQAVFG